MTDDDTFEELLKHIESLRKAIASAPGVSAQAEGALRTFRTLER